MARIGVNALYLIPGQVGGTEIYLRELLLALSVIDSANEITRLVDKQPDNRKVIEEIYYAILNRPPTEAEIKNIDLGKDPKQRQEVAQDLAWALLNSPAFLFNR